MPDGAAQASASRTTAVVAPDASSDLPAANVCGADPTVKRYLPWIVAPALFMEQLDSTILNTAVPSVAAAAAVSARVKPARLAVGPAVDADGRRHGDESSRHSAARQAWLSQRARRQHDHDESASRNVVRGA